MPYLTTLCKSSNMFRKDNCCYSAILHNLENTYKPLQNKPKSWFLVSTGCFSHLLHQGDVIRYLVRPTVQNSKTNTFTIL